MGAIADGIRGLAESVHMESMGCVTTIEVDQRAFDSLLGDLAAKAVATGEPAWTGRIKYIVMYTDAGPVTIRTRAT